MIVVLLGYMASGKSTIGEKLAQKLNYDFTDLDVYIEKQEELTITKIFETKGEIYFRKQETLYLLNILSDKTNLVLSLGGGTPCYSNNMKWIQNNTKTISVYLKTSVLKIIERLEKEKTKRPLIAHLHDKDDFTEFVAKHLFERTHFYNQADHLIITDNDPIEKIIDKIVASL